MWAVVLAGALIIGAGITVLLGGEGFSVTGWLIFSAIVFVIGMYVTTRVMENKRRATDGLWRNLVWAAFFIALIPLISLLWTVFAQGLPTLLSNPSLLTEDMSTTNGATDQATVDEGAPLAGGFVHGLIGTLMITVLATVISVPIGLMASIYLTEYSRGGLFARSITFFVDVMTGIPSIVAGLFAFAAVKLFVTTFLGTSPAHLQMVKMGLTASIALSVLMIPVVVRSTEEMLRVVPNELREASYALGVRKWKTIMKVVLPTSISGIASGVTLAIARVAGETAPILVTAGFLATHHLEPVQRMDDSTAGLHLSSAHQPDGSRRSPAVGAACMGRRARAHRHRDAAQPHRPHRRPGVRADEDRTLTQARATHEQAQKQRNEDPWQSASTPSTSTSTTAASSPSKM